MKLTDLWDLVRIPNAATAVSDIVAATAIGHAMNETLALGPASMAGAASLCLYTGGMALNDVADAATDARERPERPIPSGRITRGTAGAIAIVLLILGGGLAWLASPGARIVGVALIAAIVLYNLALAGRPLVGPLGMSLCRGLNLSLGLLAVGAGGWGFVAVAVLMLYVFGLTELSLGEVGTAQRRGVVVAVLTTGAAALGCIVLHRLAQPSPSPGDWGALAVTTAIFLGRTLPVLGRAYRDPVPRWVGPAVGMMVTCILWLGAMMAVGVGGWRWLLPFVPLAAVQEFLRRTYRVT